MLGVLCATRPRPWLFSHVHASLPRLVHASVSLSASPPRRHHSSACKIFGSAGGAASIWHAIMPRSGDGFRRGVVPVHDLKGEGSWNVAWDTRPARWLHRPDSAWLLFGVCACLAPPGCVDVVTDFEAVAVDESCGVLDKELKVEASADYADYRVTGVPADGRCLFRAIAHGDCLRNGEKAPDENCQRELADELRAKVVDELLKRREETEWFIEGDFDTYVKRIQQPFVWGGEPELLMASHVLKTPISVFNYTSGRFQLYFKGGNVSLSPLGWPSPLKHNYYYVFNAAGAASRLVFNESGDIYVKTTNGTTIQPQGSQWNSSDLDPEVNYYRATLDFSGVFTQYYHPRNSTAQPGWKIMRYVPENICDAITDVIGSGSCGYNSYCSMENKRPTCTCPYGYSLVDPSNQFGGCQPNLTLACGADVQEPPEKLYEMHKAQGFNFPLGDYERIQPYSRQDCQQFCLQDCMCAMAISGGDTCWLKRFPLGNGRQLPISDQHFVYIKTRVIRNFYPGANMELPLSPDSKIEYKAKLFLLGPLIGSLVLNSILLATVALFFLMKPKVKRVPITSSSPLETNLHSFTYETLEKATWNFKEEIGRGSYGIVYKGQLEAGSCHLVAVKRLDRLAQEREKEFRTELSSIGRTCHKNLVRLIGFCDEGMNRILVYEFMSNGTLADILFGQSNPKWNVRVGFALGIARGLVYLHEECDTPIIHCDIKPQNILIDEYLNPKISDFGLAKLLLSDQSRTTTMIRGTRGYVAPEWFKNVAVTVKVDVYSFGVMLLEIICSRRSVLMMESGEEEKALLTDWACDCFMEGKIDVLVENDEEALSDYVRLQKWVKIAIWCIHEQPEMRPTMGMVMQMLEGFVEVPNPPSPFLNNGD